MKTKFTFVYLFTACLLLSTVSFAQTVLFDFDNAPLFTSLPIDQTAGGITAHFKATGFYGYSIQNANTMGFTPQGFGGRCIYPNSVYLADLSINFDQTVTDFSIMYCCQELGCDDAATMRVTAYMNGTYIGTHTKTASNPGTWPVDTLNCHFVQGFDSVLIHYDSPPPTCQDYGVIYLADNMRVTAANATEVVNTKANIDALTITSPVSQTVVISFSLLQVDDISIFLFDITGRLTKQLYKGTLSAGTHQLNWSVKDDALAEGVYFLNVTGNNFSLSRKLIIMK